MSIRQVSLYNVGLMRLSSPITLRSSTFSFDVLCFFAFLKDITIDQVGIRL